MPEPTANTAWRGPVELLLRIGLGVAAGAAIEALYATPWGYLAIPLLLLPAWWRRAGAHCLTPPRDKP